MNKDSLNASKAFISNFKISPTNQGLLDQMIFAVKDVFAVKGYKTSFGNKLWESLHPIATEHAECIIQLLNAGATCVGKTTLGEFGCGVEGKNFEYGMSINPANPELVPGGSSSGSASAVGFGLVDFALGTDVAGSIRIPASYCGLYGMRPSHGCISMKGCLSLSPSLDTVGVLSSSFEILEKVMKVLLGNVAMTQQKHKSTNLFVLDDLLAKSAVPIRETTQQVINSLSSLFSVKTTHISMQMLDEKNMSLVDTLRYLLCGEVWENIGSWAEENNLKYGENTYVDFSYMENVDQNRLNIARLQQAVYMEKLNKMFENSLLCIPTVPELPRKRQDVISRKVNDFNYEKLRPFTVLSSIGELPQISLPAKSYCNYPIGISIIGAHGSDLFLLEVAKRLIA